MHNVRRITMSDLDERSFVEDFEKIAVAFFDESRQQGTLHFNSFLGSWRGLMNTGTAVMFGMFADERMVGTIGAIIAPNLFTSGVIASELFWYVLPEHRAHGLRLLFDLIAWADDLGVDSLLMGHLHIAVSERLEAVYGRLGFTKLETLYVRNL